MVGDRSERAAVLENKYRSSVGNFGNIAVNQQSAIKNQQFQYPHHSALRSSYTVRTWVSVSATVPSVVIT